ncbi:WD40 repeat-like protein [Coniochaeta sp. PMI_546]|nr:WD40 repeat-like protein [Coniochaeta sp. PMI_546]
MEDYLSQKSDCRPEACEELQPLAHIVRDIGHLVGAFGSCLLSSPSSIHFLIPHLCPRDSIVRQLFARDTKRLKISTSLTEQDWTDRSTCHFFSREAVTVACSERFLAVGLRNGQVEVCKRMTLGAFDHIGMLDHWIYPPQLFLAFDCSSTILATCCSTKVTVWNLHCSPDLNFPQVWLRYLDLEPSDMRFSEDGRFLMVASTKNCSIVTFDAVTGERRDDLVLNDSYGPHLSHSNSENPQGSPKGVKIRLDKFCTLAAAWSPPAMLSIWDLQAPGLIDDFEWEGSGNGDEPPPIVDVIFAQVPNPEHFAVAYQNGDIVAANVWTMAKTGMYNASSPLVVLASSSDGQILAGGDQERSIHVFSFATLVHLYRIDSPNKETRVADITFSADDLQLFDIRGECCSVWKPLILGQKSRSDATYSELHSGTRVLPEASTCKVHAFDPKKCITDLQPTTNGHHLFLGRRDGMIDVYRVSTGAIVGHIRIHGESAAVCYMDWNEDGRLLVSVDSTSRCVVSHFSRLEERTTPQASSLLDHHEREQVLQALISPCAAFLLIRTVNAVKLMSIKGEPIAEDSSPAMTSWMNHPCDASLILSVQEGYVRFYHWKTLKLSFSSACSIPVLGPEIYFGIGSSLFMSSPGLRYIVRLFPTLLGKTLFFTSLDTSLITPENTDDPMQLRHIHLGMKCNIGVLRDSLLFLDSMGWVCSVAIKDLRIATHYTRHFFIPPTWHTGKKIHICVVSENAVGLARGEHVVVFHGFLGLGEKVEIEEGRLFLLDRPESC